MPATPFIGPAYRSRSLVLSGQRCVNLYLESDEGKGGKNPAMLVGTPGLKAFGTVPGAGGIRALFALPTAELLAVRGAQVYRVNPSGAATLVGALLTSAGPVSIDSNGESALLVDGVARYSLDLLTVGAPIVVDSTDPSDRVAFIDGYLIVNRTATQQFLVSDLFSTTFDPTSFASAEGSPDKLVALIADHRELWLFGQISTEVWSNSGNVDFPFERIPGAFIQTGCAAPFSVCRMDNSIFWLGADERGTGMIWRADGYRPTRISTHAIEREIQSYPVTSDAIAYAYQQEGHAFYVLTFPTADRTWVYDASVGEWHERGWFDAFGVQHRHRPSCCAQYQGRVVVGDWQTGELSTYDLETYTERGEPIRRIRTGYHDASPDLTVTTFDDFQVDMESGVGLQAGQGVNPQAMLRFSDDGGRTWSTEAWASFGRVGEYTARARWRRLGRARDRVFEVTVTDPVKVIMLGAAINSMGGTS